MPLVFLTSLWQPGICRILSYALSGLTCRPLLHNSKLLSLTCSSCLLLPLLHPQSPTFFLSCVIVTLVMILTCVLMPDKLLIILITITLP